MPVFALIPFSCRMCLLTLNPSGNVKWVETDYPGLQEAFDYGAHHGTFWRSLNSKLQIAVVPYLNEELAVKDLRIRHSFYFTTVPQCPGTMKMYETGEAAL